MTLLLLHFVVNCQVFTINITIRNISQSLLHTTVGKQLTDMEWRHSVIKWHVIVTCDCQCNLARSTNLPEGLYILHALISSFLSLFFLLGAKLSQYLLDRFSRSFHQMEGICVNFLDPVQFFRFLKGRCHGNQFCVISKTQTTCDFCNFYTIWKGFGYRWWIWSYFFNISRDNRPSFSDILRDVAWQPI